MRERRTSGAIADSSLPPSQHQHAAPPDSTIPPVPLTAMTNDVSLALVPGPQPVLWSGSGERLSAWPVSCTGSVVCAPTTTARLARSGSAGSSSSGWWPGLLIAGPGRSLDPVRHRADRRLRAADDVRGPVRAVHGPRGPSGSAITTWWPGNGCSAVAPATRTSMWSRFLASFGSGTRSSDSRGPTPSGSHSHAPSSAPAPGSTCCSHSCRAANGAGGGSSW